MSSCDKLTTRKVVRYLKGRGGNGQVWWDLGSVSTGYCDKPWDPGKQLPLGFSLTGQERKILCMNITLAATVRAVRISVKQQATSYKQKSQASSSY